MLHRARSLCVLLALAVPIGCKSDPGTGPGTTTMGEGGTGNEQVSQGHQAIDAYVASIPDLVLPAAMSKTETPCMDASCPKDAQEGDEFCTYKHFAETVHYEKFVAFQPNSATLWPGLVVRGADAQEGLLTPIGVKLAPVTFSVSLENIANSPVGHMDEPSLSTFREERNNILAGGVTGATPAALDFDVLEVHSESQIATALGAGVNWPGGPEIAASFNFDTSNKKTKILVNFTQAYYTIDVDSPTSPKDFFDPAVTVDDIKPFADAASPPLYIQSITYGRRVLFSIESDESADAIKAALEATYKSAVNVNGNVSAEHKTVLSQSSIRAFVIGGAGGEATGAISGFDGLITYIKNGGNYSKDSPGAPVAYKLAYLDNTATKLAFTTDYSERTCSKNQGNLRVQLSSINHLAGTDVGGNIEWYGYVTVRYPISKNGVASCSSGGLVKDVWRIDEGSWVTVPELTNYTPTNPVFVDINDVAFGKGQKLCLSAHLWDEDYSTNELTADDDFGGAQQIVLFENGWDGKHVLHLVGAGGTSVDVTVNVTVK